ncbi:hypothetical protein T484DRAFT_1765476, partial [Baffinella frigidus]
MDATLENEAQSMTSKANLDIYTTSEPQIQLHKRDMCTTEPQIQLHKRVAFCLDKVVVQAIQLHKRVAFCLGMHNQAVKAMRYAAPAAVKAMRYAENAKTEWESAEERRERLKQ